MSPATKLIIVIVGLLSIAYAVWYFLPWSMSHRENMMQSGSLNIPQFSAIALQGREIFNENCAKCHGENAIGTNQGPPLLHNIYNPGHHGDNSFLRATESGVRQHHWPFGDMPQQPQVDKDQVFSIVRYIRELQEANGIFYQRHQM
ncbi:MAG: cytochrome C [Parvibaculum sp.]|jgi:cytochrome c|nr:cytochrome C [Parvibaculum sp.]|tara:strand:- start:607 stop:1044 length:438 start_codon:yes stop_codon:yes gene_type:complete